MTDLGIIIWVLIVVIICWATWDRHKIDPKPPKWKIHQEK